MVKATIFEQGDIVRVCLNPTVGRELKGDYRPCLVLTPKVVNKFGMTLIAPITQGGDYSRVQGFTATLMGLGTDTQGIVLVSGVRMMDLVARKATKIEKAPLALVNEALAILESMIESETE